MYKKYIYKLTFAVKFAVSPKFKLVSCYCYNKQLFLNAKSFNILIYLRLEKFEIKNTTFYNRVAWNYHILTYLKGIVIYISTFSYILNSQQNVKAK